MRFSQGRNVSSVLQGLLFKNKCSKGCLVLEAFPFLVVRMEIWIRCNIDIFSLPFGSFRKFQQKSQTID